MMAASVIADGANALPPGAPDDDRPLRVCYVCGDYPTFSAGKSGGIGAHTFALANAIRSAGHDVTVIANAARREDVVERGVKVRGIPLSSRRQWKVGKLLPVNWLRWSNAANRALRDLHAQSPLDVVVLPDAYGEGFRFALDPFVPFVVRFGGPASIVQQWDGRSVPLVRRAVEQRMERLPPSRASLLVCASRRFAEFISRKWNLDLSRFRYVRNPLDARRFVPGSSVVGGGSPLVLFAGHVQPLKGVQDLVDAMPLVAPSIPEVRVRIVGNDTRTGPDGGSFRTYLEHRLREGSAQGCVDFVATVPQDALVAMYQQCDVFVLPSHNDVYPNAVLEAMGCARPCIVTDTTGVAELVEKADCGRVVPPRDPAALAAAIIELLRLPREAREAMGARARKVVEDLCAPDVIARQAVEVYREAIAMRTPGARGFAGARA
jgi:glycosyltransferase involved in cell wall biosynthesis